MFCQRFICRIMLDSNKILKNQIQSPVSVSIFMSTLLFFLSFFSLKSLIVSFPFLFFPLLPHSSRFPPSFSLFPLLIFISLNHFLFFLSSSFFPSLIIYFPTLLSSFPLWFFLLPRTVSIYRSSLFFLPHSPFFSLLLPSDSLFPSIIFSFFLSFTLFSPSFSLFLSYYLPFLSWFFLLPRTVSLHISSHFFLLRSPSCPSLVLSPPRQPLFSSLIFLFLHGFLPFFLILSLSFLFSISFADSFS